MAGTSGNGVLGVPRGIPNYNLLKNKTKKAAHWMRVLCQLVIDNCLTTTARAKSCSIIINYLSKIDKKDQNKL